MGNIVPMETWLEECLTSKREHTAKQLVVLNSWGPPQVDD